MNGYSLMCGDSRSVLQTLPENSVHCCVTSPPYFNLRDYGVNGQIGIEETPETYINALVEVFREVRRVLRPDGTAWVNIADTYAANRTYQLHDTRGTKDHTDSKGSKVPTGCKPKDMIGIPWMLAFALRDDGWYLRQDIIWQKPNCMPESVKDRCTKSHEHIFLLSKSPQYYFDAEAISEPIAESSKKRFLQDIERQTGSNRQPGKTNGAMKAAMPRFGRGKDGEQGVKEYVPILRRNKRDVWSISTKGFKGAHFAVFPEELVEPCVFAGSPINGTVLDPFCGSGTVGVVSLKNGRDFIGIELNPAYVEIAQERIRRVKEI